MISCRSSTVYKYTSSNSPASGSMSRGTAMSIMSMGRCLRCLLARSIAPLPRMGSWLAVVRYVDVVLEFGAVFALLDRAFDRAFAEDGQQTHKKRNHEICLREVIG